MKRILCGLVLVGISFFSCSKETKKNVAPKARKASSTLLKTQVKTDDPKWLSDYNFFGGKLAALRPNDQVYAYTINTPLFSNYAKKERFIYLPEEKKINFKPQGPLDFDNGTVLIKNFYYPLDETAVEQERKILETRLLIKEKSGWKPLNYLWKQDQSDAELNYVGAKIDVNWKDSEGETRNLVYQVPNLNQCKNCHSRNTTISPIGVTAAQLNKHYEGVESAINQLDYFKQENLLKGFESSRAYEAMPVWNDALTATVEERARAYLDANCAHCHSAQGSAKNSGLYLEYHEKDARRRGVFKPPIAAGKGSGDFQYDIVPGKPEASIFIYRVGSTDPAIRMPEIGRSVVHEEGLALLTQYIKELQAEDLGQ